MTSLYRVYHGDGLAAYILQNKLQVYRGNHLIPVRISGQYVDMLNIEYINMTKEQRLKKLSHFARRIVEFRYDEEHNEIKNVVMKAAREYRCEPGAIELRGLEYPEEIEW